MYALRVHETAKGRIVAACDTDILGETFTEGDTRLHVAESFYLADEVELQQVIDALQDYTTANLVGEQLIAALQDRDIVSDADTRTVDGVPHAQLFRL